MDALQALCLAELHGLAIVLVGRLPGREAEELPSPGEHAHAEHFLALIEAWIQEDRWPGDLEYSTMGQALAQLLAILVRRRARQLGEAERRAGHPA